MSEKSPIYNRIKKNLKALKSYLNQNQITCFRVFDWDMPEYPLCIDVYENKIHLAEYKTRHQLTDDQYQLWLHECISAVKEIFSVEEPDIFFKKRERHKGTQYEKVNETKTFYTVQENGIKFLVNLNDYLDTGLFLDHRVIRKQVMSESKGKHVLNLFSYTGSFSVYAAMGGAFTTTTLDLSNTYLNWAKENFKANNLSLAKHSFIKTDCKEWLKQNPSRLFDIIVLDPPTLSKSKMTKTTFDVQLDHVEMVNHALNHLVEGGKLYFSNNYRDFKFDSSKIIASKITDISLLSIPQDFRNKKIHFCWEIIK